MHHQIWAAPTLRGARGRINVRGMTTFVLVHGAWGGSYGFRTVRGPLRSAGHEVFTPIRPDGTVAARSRPRTTPDDPLVLAAIEENLPRA